MNDGNAANTPVPRCCPQHPDWTVMGHHLVREFPELAPFEVSRELTRAKEATDLVRLEPADALFVGELIARYQLMIRTGRLEEVARLDPESHPARRRHPVPATR